jgi:hypothetical protein
MYSHIKILGWINIIFGALGMIAALVVFSIFGGLAGLVGFSGDADSRVAAPILFLIGGMVLILLIVLSVPGLIGGIGLLKFKPWARILMIILSALHILNIPIGTLLGVYGLWALLNPETEALFANGGVLPQGPYAPQIPVQPQYAPPPYQQPPRPQ